MNASTSPSTKTLPSPVTRPSPSPTTTPASAPTSPPTPTPAPTTPPTGTSGGVCIGVGGGSCQPPSPSGLKPELSGLLDRNGAPSVSLAPDLAGWVVNVTWAELQPTSGSVIAADNPIDQAVALIQSNPAYANMHLRIRIMAGIDSPGWVEAMSGGSVDVYNDQSGTGGNVPRFWTAPVEQAYANLQTLLAAEYDNDPEIEDVTIAGCMTVFDEPLILETSDAATVSNLLAAGYTEAADETCQEDAIADQQVWVHTHSSIALNPYQTISADGSTGIDEGFTQTLMAYCRSTLGNRCTLGNNSIRTASLGTQYDDMYGAMQATGPGIYFQTAQAGLVGNLQSTIQWAVCEGANDVELPAGYASILSAGQLASDNQALSANPQ
ncbi:MAG: hypothetical protein ABSB36_05925 [Candidatus Dormibacteria bacterium]